MQDLRGNREKAFHEALEEQGFQQKGFIVRTQHDWAPAFLVFTIGKGGKWGEAHVIPWKDDLSYDEAIKLIPKGKK